MKPNSRVELQGYNRHARMARAKFRRRLASLPPSCRVIALKAHRDRSARAAGKLSLGEMTPWILADLLAVDPNRVSPIAVSWLHILLAVLMLDDVLDREASVDSGKESVHFVVSGLLMQRGVTSLIAEVPNLSSRMLSKGFSLCAEASVFELENHRNNVQFYSERDLKQVSRKLAMLEICEAAVLAISKSSIRKPVLESAISQMSLGLQILDDLTDMQEDWAVQSLTLPLTSAIREGSLPSSFDRISPTELFARVVYSGAFEESLGAAVQALRSAAESLEVLDRRGTGIYRYIAGLIENLEDLRSRGAAVRATLRKSKLLPEHPWTVNTGNEMLQDLISRLSIVAQAT